MAVQVQNIGPRLTKDALADGQPSYVVSAEQLSAPTETPLNQPTIYCAAATHGYNAEQIATIFKPLHFHTMNHTDDDQLSPCVASARQAVEQLSAMYRQLGLEEEGKNFMTEIFTPMLASEPDPNDLEDQLENREVSNVELMKLSCAYVVGAISAETAGNHENAWVAVSHAQYWMGMAYGLGFMKGAGALALRERGRAGGKKANENQYGELQRLARKLAMQHLEWSRMQAARLITPEVVEASRTMANVQPIRAKDPVDTVYDWLEGLPFGDKRKPRSANTKR